MTVEVTISDALQKKLSEARMRLALRSALTQTMYDLMRESMKLAPQDTGNLRRSHSVAINLSGDMIEGLLKNSANYWQFVEFGTSKMDAKPFVTPALATVAPANKVQEYFKKYYKG